MYHIYSDYNNYRWTDFNSWSKAKEVDDLVQFLVADMGKRKNSGYRANMKVLIMDLYQSYLADPDQYLAYHRGKDRYLVEKEAGKSDRYIKNPHVSHTYFVGCLDHLKSVKLIKNSLGGQFYNEKLGEYFGYVSRMRPTEKLVDLWKEYQFTPEMISKFKPDELIILKGPEEEKTYMYKGETKSKYVKPPMDCPDTPVTRRMTKIIERYNNLLERTHIDVDIECIAEQDRDALVEKLSNMQLEDKRIVLRLADKRVYRVFNNGSFEQGGRFYGAWWIGAPSIARKYITINGESTTELDYSGIHVHLLYALKGINYADRQEDPYTLDDGLPDRELNKLILLTAFNAKDAYSTASAVFDELREAGKLTRYQLYSFDQIYAKLDLLKEKHEPIADQIANDYGLRLQYLDSCIIERLIQTFTRMNIPILTIHDSVICQDRYEDYVKDRMWQLYSKTIDEMLNCKIEYQPKNPHAKLVLRYLDRFKPAFNKGINSSTVMNAVINKLWSNRYSGKIPVKYNNIIKIKDEKRGNKCSEKCNHYNRLKHSYKYMRNIVIKLEEHEESYTGVLVIK